MLSHHKKVPKSDYKALKALWYQKLKNEGFKDIESAQNSDLLNQWDSAYFQLRYDPDSFAAKESYFYRARQFLEIHDFKHPIQKQIWKLHSDGLGIRQIAIHIGIDPYLSLPLFGKTIAGSTYKDGIAEILNPLKKVFFEWMNSQRSNFEE